MKLREGIVAVIKNSNGQVLMFERSDISGSFQFPQGGIEKSETPEDALLRELLEEIGTNEVEIINRAANKTTYILPKPIKGFDGAIQTWFLCQFKKDQKPNLKISDNCFKSFKWVEPKEVLNEIVQWKRKPFLQGLQQLGILD